mgnify:CR=1 FL=1
MNFVRRSWNNAFDRLNRSDLLFSSFGPLSCVLLKFRYNTLYKVRG